PLAGAGGDGGEDVGVLDEVDDVRGVLVLLDLVLRRRARTEVGDGGRHDEDVGVGGGAVDGGGELGRRLDVDELDRRVVGERGGDVGFRAGVDEARGFLALFDLVPRRRARTEVGEGGRHDEDVGVGGGAVDGGGELGRRLDVDELDRRVLGERVGGGVDRGR